MAYMRGVFQNAKCLMKSMRRNLLVGIAWVLNFGSLCICQCGCSIHCATLSLRLLEFDSDSGI